MVKKLLLATVAAGLVSAAALPVQVAPAMAAMTCKEAAKMKYPGTPLIRSMKERRAYMKACKKAWKAAQ